MTSLLSNTTSNQSGSVAGLMTCPVLPVNALVHGEEKIIKELPLIADLATKISTSVMDHATTALENGNRLCNFSPNLYDLVVQNQVNIDPTDLSLKPDFLIDNVLELKTITPIFRVQSNSDAGSWGEYDTISSNPEVAICFNAANEKLATVLKAVVTALEKYAQTLSTSYRNFCNYYCVYNNVQRYLKAAPT